VAIVEDLVPPRLPLELHHKDGFYFRPLTGCRSCIDSFNGHAFREKVELIQGACSSS
jgi:hypothetical protein